MVIIVIAVIFFSSKTLDFDQLQSVPEENLSISEIRMNKKIPDKKKILDKMISSSSNSYEDKIAVLRYLIKNDSKNISSVFSSALKKKK